jgi:hypothetical protein
MIISQPEITCRDGEVLAASRVTLQRGTHPLPQHLFYAYPEAYARWVSRRSDAFLLSLAQVAMLLGEDIHVEGEVSPLLLYGLEEFQRVFQHWFPRTHHPIRITADAATPAPQRGDAVVCPFSGGVDSFGVLKMHTPPHCTHPSLRLTHAVFMQGFDIPLWEQREFADNCAAFRPLLAEQGVELIPGRTNVHSFSVGLAKWVHVYGAPLLACGMLLQDGIRHFLVASSLSINHCLIPNGSNVFTNPWLRTEDFESTLCLTPLNRVERTAYIADFPPAQHGLRVCANVRGHGEHVNCGQCEKCVRTAVQLDLFDSLQHFTTLPRPKLGVILRKLTPLHPQYLRYMFRPLLARKKFQHLPLIFLLWLRSLAWKWIRSMVPQGLYARIRNRFYPPQQDPFHRDSLPGSDSGR